jgi:hypothetical protein
VTIVECPCLLGDHYSELSVLGCKYRFYPDNPLKRRLIRGSILGAKVLAAPMILCLAMVAGTLCAGIGLPAYCCCMIARQIKVGNSSVSRSQKAMKFPRRNDVEIIMLD